MFLEKFLQHFKNSPLSYFKIFIFILGFKLIMSCGVRDPEEGEQQLARENTREVRLEKQDPETLRKRVHDTGEGSDKMSYLLSSSQAPFSLSVLKEITPIQPHGQANSITIDGDKAYVGYMTLGEGFGGGVDVFDISDDRDPVLMGGYLAPRMDVNAVAVSHNQLFVAGSHDSSEPACLGEFSVSEGELSETGHVTSLQSYTGIDINVFGDSVYVTSGNEGGIQKISSWDLELQEYLPFKDVRGIERRGTLFYVFAGTPAQFIVLDQDLNIHSWFPLQIPLTKEDKSRLHVGENVAFVAMNDRGFEAVCLETGEVLSEVSKFENEDLNTSPNYALDVVAYGRYVITASGYKGLKVYDAGENWDSPYCNDFQMTKLQQIEFSDGAPATHVAIVGQTLFVTAGERGLKVLSLGEIR